MSYIAMLVGHFIGDYFLQPRYMAIHKKDNNENGADVCRQHCIIYTCVVCLMLFFSGYTISFFTVMTIYYSHWYIDRSDLIKDYMNVMGIRSYDDKYMRSDLDKTVTVREAMTITFGAIVYVVIDNVSHILAMTLIIYLGI